LEFKSGFSYPYRFFSQRTAKMRRHFFLFLFSNVS
jgi:hypothetical protein